MSTKMHVSRGYRPSQYPQEKIEVDKPDIIEKEITSGKLSKMIHVGAPLMVMILMLISVKVGARRPSPTMFMMPLMLIAGMLQGGAGGGHGDDKIGKLNHSRKDYEDKLNTKRKKIHTEGKKQHDVAVRDFPHPFHILWNVGSPFMWSFTKAPKKPTDTTAPAIGVGTPAPQGGLPLKSTETKVTIREVPYLKARMGVGIAKLEPGINIESFPRSDNVDPYMRSRYLQFILAQNWVSNIPRSATVHNNRIVLSGEREIVLGLVRSMMLSLSFNHRPLDVFMVICTDDPNFTDWNWATPLHVLGANTLDQLCQIGDSLDSNADMILIMDNWSIANRFSKGSIIEIVSK